MSTIALVPAFMLANRRTLSGQKVLPDVRYVSDEEGSAFHTVGGVFDSDGELHVGTARPVDDYDSITYQGQDLVGVLAESEVSVSGRGLLYRIAHPDYPSRSRNSLAYIAAVRAGKKQNSDDTLVIINLASDRQIVPDDRLERALLAHFLNQARDRGFKQVIINRSQSREGVPVCISFPPTEMLTSMGFREDRDTGIWAKTLVSNFA